MRAIAILCCLTAWLIGCTTTQSGVVRGLPAAAKLVGNGSDFTYVMPADGRIYWVYESQVEGLKHVSKGETFHALGPVEGDDPTKDFDEYEYYFEPDDLKPVKPPAYR